MPCLRYIPSQKNTVEVDRTGTRDLQALAHRLQRQPPMADQFMLSRRQQCMIHFEHRKIIWGVVPMFSSPVHGIMVDVVDSFDADAYTKARDNGWSILLLSHVYVMQQPRNTVLTINSVVRTVTIDT